MTTLYLHVGLHKTGTSALQYFLNLNRQALASQGICYPREGISKGPAHHQLISAIRRPMHPLFSVEKSFEEMLLAIRQEAKGFRHILISSEILSESIDLHMLTLFQGIADQVKVILYLRRQAEYIESIYNEHVKSGALWKEFQDFDYAKKLPNLDYNRICEKWAALFGKENLIVKPFEANQFVGGDLFRDFLDIFSINLSEDFQVPAHKINISLGRDELELKRLFNALAPQRQLIAPLLKHSRQQMRTPGYVPYPLFSVRQRQEVVEMFHAANQQIAAKYLHGAQASLFSPHYPTKSEQAYPGLSSTKIREIMHFLKQEIPGEYEELLELIAENLDAQQSHKQVAARRLSGE